MKALGQFIGHLNVLGDYYNSSVCFENLFAKLLQVLCRVLVKLIGPTELYRDSRCHVQSLSSCLKVVGIETSAAVHCEITDGPKCVSLDGSVKRAAAEQVVQLRNEVTKVVAHCLGDRVGEVRQYAAADPACHFLSLFECVFQITAYLNKV